MATNKRKALGSIINTPRENEVSSMNKRPSKKRANSSASTTSSTILPEESPRETASRWELLLEKAPQLSPPFLNKLFMSSPDHPADRLYHSAAIDALLDIVPESISEDDPLFFILCDVNDADSIGYCNGGNYGIAQNTPGYLPWPGGAPPMGVQMPAGVNAVPPNALGSFLSQQNGFVDVSRGRRMVFRVENLQDLNSAQHAVHNSDQFVRYGATMAARLNRPVELPLVEFVVLTTLNSSEQLLSYFNLA